MMRCTVQLECTEKNADQVVLLLRALAGQTRAQEGCSDCRARRDIFNERRVDLVSEWNTRADLERYVNSTTFLMLLSAMELSATPPEVCFNEVSESRGMDYIWEIRDGGPVSASDSRSFSDR